MLTIEDSKNSLKLPEFFSAGSAKLKTNNISWNILSEFYEGWGGFFESEEKIQYHGDIAWPIGYVGKKSLYQGHHIPYEDFYYHPSSEICPYSLQDITNLLYGQLTHIANDIISNLFKLVDADGFLPTNTIFGSVLRIIYYPALSEGQKYFKYDDDIYVLNTPHKDHNLFTLLLPATSAGLEVVSKDGKFTSFDAADGELILLSGEQLEVITRGKLIAPLHQVVCNKEILKNNMRMSAAFFIKICDMK